MNSRRQRLAAKGHILVPVVLTLFALGLASGSVMAGEPGSLRLKIALYSGRPDPVLNLQATEAALVLNILSEASPASAQDSQSAFPWGMGYTSVTVERWGTNNLIDLVAQIRGTNILVTSGTSESWFHAPDTRLEDYLLNLASMHGVISAEMYDYIQALIHPTTDRAFLVRITLTGSGNREARLDWSVGPRRYAVSQRGSLVGGPWWSAVGVTNGTNYTVALTNATGFFSVSRVMPPN